MLLSLSVFSSFLPSAFVLCLSPNQFICYFPVLYVSFGALYDWEAWGRFSDCDDLVLIYNVLCGS